MMRAESKRLATVLDEKCAATPTHPAILYRDRTICYAELQDESLAAARSLFALGIGRGDRVGILLGNQPEWVVMALAASYLGATLVPLNTRSDEHTSELQSLMRISYAVFCLNKKKHYSE